MFNPLTAEWALGALKDFTLSNARRFYSSMGNPLDGKGLRPWYGNKMFDVAEDSNLLEYKEDKLLTLMPFLNNYEIKVVTACMMHK